MDFKVIGQRIAGVIVSSASVIILVLLWEAVSRSGMLSAYLLPAPSAVAVRLWSMLTTGTLIADLASTLWRTVFGFLMAAAVGIPLGLLMARVPLVEWFFDPIVSIGFPMPKIAFLPAFILWFGLFDSTKLLMIAFHAVFPIAAATWSGARTVERIMIWSAQSLGVSERRAIWEVVLPATLPSIMTGLQVALPISLIVALVTEFLMGGSGIGARMINASRYADSTGVFAGIVAIAILGIVVMRFIQWARRYLLRWHQEMDTGTA